VKYPKSLTDSGLRVILHMAVRGHLSVPDHCNRWYLTFDGNKCTNPDTIEMLDYSANIYDNRQAMDSESSDYFSLCIEAKPYSLI